MTSSTPQVEKRRQRAGEEAAGEKLKQLRRLRDTETILDEFLVLRAQDGDSKALEELIKRQHPTLLKRVKARTADADAAHDVTQEVWTTVCRTLGTLRDPAKFQAWISQIARHKCADWIRNKVRQRSQQSLTEEPPEDDASRDQAVREEMLQNLRRQLKELPPNQRELLSRFYLDGWSLQQLSHQLQVPLGTIKSRLFHAREKLKQAVGNSEVRKRR